MRLLASFAALAMVVSLFLPWVAVPFGNSPSPFDAGRAFWEVAQEAGLNWGDLAGEVLEQSVVVAAALAAFALSVLLALLFGLTGLMGWFPNGARLIIAVLVAVVALIGWLQLSDLTGQLAEALGPAAPDDLISQAMEFLRPGAYLYFGGGVILLLTSFIPARD